jgi:hypothetical protein
MKNCRRCAAKKHKIKLPDAIVLAAVLVHGRLPVTHNKGLCAWRAINTVLVSFQRELHLATPAFSGIQNKMRALERCGKKV